MSMNLAFEVKGGGIVDFPFQTPTDLSYAVLATKGYKKQLALIDAEMKKWGWEKEIRTEKLNSIEQLLKNPNLKMIVI